MPAVSCTYDADMPHRELSAVLVGGPPGAGKTTLGRALAPRFDATSLTVDDLLVAARCVTTPDTHPALFPMHAAGGHAAYFIEGPPERLIADSLAQERVAWPLVQNVIAAHRAERSPVVIDGWLLRPRDVAALELDDVVALFLHPDPELLWARERANDWTAGTPDPERMLDHFVHRSLWRNELVAGEARDLDLAVLDLDGSESVEEVADLAMACIAAT